MFPQGGGAGWSSSVYPSDGSSPYPRDPRTAARSNNPSTNQAYEAGSGWTQGWPHSAQWTYTCPQSTPPPYQTSWSPSVGPQPGVNCPPIGIPPPVGDWSCYTSVSNSDGHEENRHVEQGGHQENGQVEGTNISDLSLFLSNYCNAKPVRHLVAVSPATEGKDVPESKGCDESTGEKKMLLEKMDSATSETEKGLPSEKTDSTTQKRDATLETSTNPIPVGGEGTLLEAIIRATNMKRKVVSLEQTDINSSNGGKRLLLEKPNCAPSLVGKTPHEKLDSSVGTGKMGATLENTDSATNSGKNAESLGKPDSATSTWTAGSRDMGMSLEKLDRTVSCREKGSSQGKPDKTVSSRERGLSIGKMERTVSSKEKRMFLEKPDRTVGSRDKRTFLEKPDRTASSVEKGTLHGKSERTASGSEKRMTLGKLDRTDRREKLMPLERLDIASSARCSGGPRTPDASIRKNMNLENILCRNSITGGDAARVCHVIPANSVLHKAPDLAEQQALLVNSAQEVAVNPPDARTAAILAKKEEIEREYEQNCRTFFLVAAMLLEREPSIEQTVVSALRKTLREISTHCVQELQNFIELYDVDRNRR